MAGVLLALVCVQALGFAHRIVHSPSAVAMAGDHAGHLPGIEHARSTLALFPNHDNDSGCRLYDGAGLQLFALPATLFVSSLPAEAGPACRFARQVAGRRAALFEARGPPVSR